MTPSLLTGLILLAISCLIGIIGFFISRTYIQGTEVSKKVQEIYGELLIITNKIQYLEKTQLHQETFFTEKLSESIGLLNSNIEKLTKAVEPISIIVYRLEQVEKNLESMNKSV